METITTKNIRNVCLLGHGGSGKTSLAESMLYISKASERLGKITEGNTVCDSDPEEIKRGFSLSAAAAVLTWKDIKINILDAPGYYDFEGEARQCVRVADGAIIVVDGKAGIEVGTELAWDMATDAGLPKSFFINRFDDGEARFYKVFTALRERFGVTVCPLHIPCIDGDKVVVRPQSYADDGQIVVARIEDEATVKRLSRKDGEIWLLPENDAYPPICGNEAELIGLVKAVVREY